MYATIRVSTQGRVVLLRCFWTKKLLHRDNLPVSYVPFLFSWKNSKYVLFIHDELITDLISAGVNFRANIS